MLFTGRSRAHCDRVAAGEISSNDILQMCGADEPHLRVPRSQTTYLTHGPILENLEERQSARYNAHWSFQVLYYKSPLTRQQLPLPPNLTSCYETENEVINSKIANPEL